MQVCGYTSQDGGVCLGLPIFSLQVLGLSGVISFWARVETLSVIIMCYLALGTTELFLLCMKVCEFSQPEFLNLHFEFIPVFLFECILQKHR